MSIKCIFGFHSWDKCLCKQCGKIRDEHHDWLKDCEICSICGTKRDHHWYRDDCEICSYCGKKRDFQHDWIGCKCSKCKKTRDEQQ